MTLALATYFAMGPRLFRIPEAMTEQPQVTIAIRVREYAPIASWTGGATFASGAAAGDPALLAKRAGNRRALFLNHEGNSYAFDILYALMGVANLALFFFQREDTEYLWFAVLLLAAGADTRHRL